MEKEYIERDSLLAWLENLNASRYLISTVEDKNRFPAADVAPVKHGKWKYSKVKYDDDYICSVCGVTNEILTNYCPNCGACMDGGNE